MGRRPDPKVLTYTKADGTTSYRVRIRVRGRQTTETFDSLAQATAFAIQCKDPLIGPERAVELRARSDVADSAYVPTVAEFLPTHINSLTGVEQRTRADYVVIAERSWLPIFGHLRIDDVTTDDVARWVNNDVRAPKTIKNAHSLLSALFANAVQRGLIDRNPAYRTRLPRAGEESGRENMYLTYDEFDDLMACTPGYWHPLLVTMFGTGARWSELTALQIRDIDSRNATMRITKAWKKDPDGYKIGPPKSRASRRTIALPDEVMDHTAEIRQRASNDLLFVTPTQGNWVRHSNFYNRVWKPSCERASLDPSPRIHDARHTHASWLIAQGIPLEVIQDRLGHEDYGTTRRVYGHLLPDLRRKAATAASAAFASTHLRALPSAD